MILFRYVDVQPKLQPNHWRLLDSRDSPAQSSSSDGAEGPEASLFLSSAMIRHLDSTPLPRNRNASYYDLTDEVSENKLHQAQTKPQRGRRGRQRVKREDISAALSKNITMILEDLLKDYDKTERPAFKQGNSVRPIISTSVFS